MKILFGLATLFTVTGCIQAQTQVDFLTQVKNKYGYIVNSNATNTNGGYVVFPPVTYNPYDSNTTCFDIWGNPVQQPLPAAGQPPFASTNVVLWNSLSPSLQFAAGTGTYGLVQKMVVTSPATTNAGPCGTPLPVETDYGLNTNGYFFGRGGLATDNPIYNSIQSLQGGIVANSFTAGVLYPAGTTVCTTMAGAVCTMQRVLTVAEYLGGHTDTGHSNGPPQGNSIQLFTNPFSGGEGLVAGQMYYDDTAHCEEVYSGTTWGCIGNGGGGTPGGANTQVQFNNTGAFGGNSNFAWNNSTGNLSVCVVLAGICTATSGVNAQAFSSAATGTAVAFTDIGANFTIRGNGQGNFNTLNVGAGSPFTVDAAGHLTVVSCSGCGGAGSPGGANTQIQFNNTGAFGGSASLSWNNASGNVSVCTVLGGICTATSGVNAQAFSSSATGAAVAFTDVGANFTILGNGQGNFNTLNVGAGSPFTVDVGGHLTVVSCTGCGGSVAGANSQIQFNNTGVFGSNTNLTWNNASGNVSVCTVLGGICTASSGVNAQAFSSSATGGATAYTDAGANFTILGNGQGNFNTLNVGAGAPFSVSVAGNVATSGALSGAHLQNIGTGDNPNFRSLSTGTNNGAAALTGAGATVSNSLATIAMFTFDTGGACGIGTGEPAPGIACASDARMKSHITGLPTALESIMNLRPVTYDWKANGNHEVGFVAQEVRQVLPQLVTELPITPTNDIPDGKMLMLSQEGMIPWMVKAIQEQQIEINALRAATGYKTGFTAKAAQ